MTSMHAHTTRPDNTVKTAATATVTDLNTQVQSTALAAALVDKVLTQLQTQTGYNLTHYQSAALTTPLGADFWQALAELLDKCEQAQLTAPPVPFGVFAQMSQAVIVLDNQQRILWLNPAAAVQYDADADAMRGHALTELYTEQWLSSADKVVIQAALAERKCWHGESVQRKRNGETRFVHSTLCVLSDATGQATGLLAIVDDISERGAVLDERRQKQLLTQTIIEDSLTVIYIHDLLTQQNLYVSATAATVLGYTWDEFQAFGQGLVQKLMHPADQPALIHHWHQLSGVSNGAVLEFEYRMQHKNGTWRWFLTRDTVLRRSVDGRPQQVLGMAVDITARKHAEEVLRASEAFTRTLLNSSPDCVKVLDRNGQLLQMNSAGLCLMEIDNIEPLIGQPWETLWPPDCRTMIREALRAASKGEQGRFQGLCPTAKGKLKWWDVIVVAVQAEQGAPTHFISVSRDITEMKHTEEQLHLNERHLKLALEAGNTGVWAWDLRTKALTWSPELYGLLCLATEPVINSLETFLALVHVDDRLRMEKCFTRVATGETTMAADCRIRCNDGSERWISVKGEVIEYAHGQPVRMVGVITDITGRKTSERQLQFHASLLDYAYDAVIATDLELNLTAWNRGAEVMYGWRAAEVLGRKAHEVMRSTLTADQRTAALHQMATTDRYQVEVTTHHRDGTPILVEGYTVAMRDEQGQIRGYMSINRDIGARKRAEEALRLREAQLNTILYNMPAAVYMLTTDHHYLFVNRIYEQENKITNREIQGQSIYDRWPAEIAKALVANEQQVLRTKAPLEIEEVVLRDRKTHYYATIKAPLLNEANEPYAIIGISTDITERKQAEAALRRSEERYRTLFETMDEGFCVFEMIFDVENKPVDYRFLEVNPAFARFTGLEDPIGKTARQLVPNLEAHWFDIYGRVALTGEPQRFVEGSAAMGRWFEVYAFRFGAAENRQVALLFSDITARKQGEDQVRRQEELLRLVTDNVPGLIAYVSSDETYRFVNATFETWFQCPRQQIIGKTVRELIGGDEWTRLSSYRQQALAGQDVSYETHFTYPDGVTRAVWGRYRAHFAADGTVQGFYLFMMDISERTRRELHQQFLSQLGIQLRLLSDIDAIMTHLVRSIGNHLGVSGCRVNEIQLAQAQFSIQKDWAAIDHPASGVYPLAELAPASILAELQSGQTVVVMNMATDPRTEPIADNYRATQTTAFIGVPIFRQGQWSATLSVREHTQRQWHADEVALLETIATQFQPLLEKVRIEQALSHSEERLRLALASGGLGIWEWEPANNTYSCTEQLYKLFGLAAEEPLTYERAVGIIHPEDQSALLNLRTQMVTQQGEYTGEYRIIYPTGEMHWLAERSVAIHDQQNDLVRILGVNFDITERKVAEQALQHFNEQLEQRVQQRTAQLERSNRELDQFAYVASHDLKAPLRGIEHLATWISEDAFAVLPESSREHLIKLRVRIKRMERLLNDLLAYSRVGRRDGEPEAVNTEALVNDVIALLDVPANFAINIVGELPNLVTPKAPLEMIMRNLIGNAIKHHHEPGLGAVWVSAKTLENFVEFCIRDNGPGIDAQYHERIFGVFQTLNPRDQMEGSGMGLALVKKAVEYRGGIVRVASTLNEGTAFYFTWPKVVRANTEPN